MSNGAFISAVVCNYNYGDFIGAAIESVLSQDYDHWELIIVDDGSTDHSREVIERYRQANPQRVRVLLKENEGQGQGFNDAVAMSRGEILCFLDSDDLWLPGKLSMVARWFSQRDDIAVLQHGLQYLDGDKPADEPFDYQLSCGDLLQEARRTLQLPQFVPTTGLAFHRRVLDKVLPIPKGFRSCADGYITRTSMCHGFVLSEPGVYGYYRRHSGNSVLGNVKHNVARYINLLLVPNLNKYYRANGIDLEYPTPRFRPNVSQHMRDLKAFSPWERLRSSYLFEDLRGWLSERGVRIDGVDRRLAGMRGAYAGRECHILGRNIDPEKLDWDALRDAFVFVADVNALHPQVRGLENGMYCVSDVKFWEKRWDISPNMIEFLDALPAFYKLFELPARPRRGRFPHYSPQTYLFKTVDRTRGVWKGDLTLDASKRLIWGHHVVLDMCLPLAFHLGFTTARLHGCDWDYLCESRLLKDFFAMFCHNNDYNLSESILPYHTAHGRTDLLWEQSFARLVEVYWSRGMRIKAVE